MWFRVKLRLRLRLGLRLRLILLGFWFMFGRDLWRLRRKFRNRRHNNFGGESW